MLTVALFLSLLQSCVISEYQHSDNYNYVSASELSGKMYGKLKLLITAEKILCFKLDTIMEKVDKQFSNQRNYIENVYGNVDRKIQTKFEEFQKSTQHGLENFFEKVTIRLNSIMANTSICPNISVNNSHPIKYPSNCAEAVGLSNKSGLYKIQIPDSVFKPFYIYCVVDPDGGPAWTIIQRRTDGSQNFFLNWQDYKHGFGNLENEYFIGLDKLHELTTSSLQELWIKLEDFENVVKHAKYDKFAIGDENQAYALNVLGKFSGDAGDSMKVHAGQKFSTKDVDNDNNSGENCAQSYYGAWWYYPCHHSNLNGLYLHGDYGLDKYAQGINWYSWHGHAYSLKYTHMAIRPVSVK